MKLSFARLFFFFLFMVTSAQQLFAQAQQGYAYASLETNKAPNITPADAAVIVRDNSGELKVLADLENSFNKKPSRKLLLSFLREINNSGATDEQQRGAKLNLHLARLFAKLRLYPLVMKCYLKNNIAGDDVYRKGFYIRQQSEDSDSVKLVNDSLTHAGLLAINSRDSLLLKSDSGFYNHDGKEVQSRPVGSGDIINPFADGKTAVKYALLVHIQQAENFHPVA